MSDDKQESPTNASRPGGLLARASGGTQNNSANQNASRPASRFGQSPTNATNNSAPAPAPPRPSRFSPFSRQRQLDWAMLPAKKTVVKFDMEGLGDPFYKLLGHQLNPAYGEIKAVAEVLEKGGDSAETLTTHLDSVWKTYNLDGAVLVYRWNPKSWGEIAQAALLPQQEDQSNPFDDSTPEAANQEAKPPADPNYTCLRALDLQLVLNVLARARTQLLLAAAPIVFSQQYLNRALIADDPRLLELVRATGYLTEKL